ncbi:MAG: HRDC domain-containing protein, partial [Acidimicrobiales bacterium]
WRDRAARAALAPAAALADDDTLAEIARRRPRSQAELAEIAGFGPLRAARFGAAVLAALAEPSPTG